MFRRPRAPSHGPFHARTAIGTAIHKAVLSRRALPVVVAAMASLSACQTTDAGGATGGTSGIANGTAPVSFGLIATSTGEGTARSPFVLAENATTNDGSGAGAEGGDGLPAGLDSPSLAGKYLAARHAQRESDFLRASELFDKALQDAPGNPTLQNLAMAMSIAAGRFDRALELAPDVYDRARSGYGLAALTLAGQAFREGDYERVETLMKDVRRDAFSRYPAPIYKAWAAAGRGDAETAIREIRVLSRENAGFRVLERLHTALLHLYLDKPKDALVVLSGEFTELTEAPMRIVRALARAQLATGDKAAAEKTLAEYTDANPGLEVAAADRKELAETGTLTPLILSPAAGAADGLYQLAIAFRGRADTFTLDYGRIASFIDPEFDLARLVVAGILENEGRFERAIAELEKVPESSLYSWEARLRIGDALVQLERDDEAIRMMEEMARERPDNTEPLMSIGRLLRLRERYGEATAVYDRVLDRKDELSPEDWVIFYFRGITLERTKKWAQAEADFLKALELKPEDPFVLNYLGYSWVDRGENIERAKEMIKSAVEQRSTDGYIVDSLGWVHYKLGDFEKAVEQLERAVQLRPQDPVINDHLGDAYWRVGRKREARFQWERSLGLEPEEDMIEGIEKKIRFGMDAWKPVATE